MGRTWRQRNMKKQRPASKHSVSLNYVLLFKWLKSNGFRCRKLQPAEFHDTGRGLLTLNSIPSGKCIISLPGRLLITSQTVMASDLGADIQRYIPRLSPLLALCIYLINEQLKGVDSFWHPYIQVLPTDFTTPVYYSQEELQWLPTRARQAAMEQIQTVTRQYLELKEFMSNIIKSHQKLAETFSYEHFRWAWCVVNTRSVYMLQPRCQFLSNEIDHYALAPYLDLLNHSVDAKVDAGYNYDTKRYEIITWTAYSKYQQVYINYGPHNNTRLLVEYGFVLPSNCHNAVQFDLDQIKSNPMFSSINSSDKKLDFIREHKLQSDLSCLEDGLSWNLIKTLQILSSPSPCL
ncbi:SET domain-containing protein 4 isoform X2 [Lingula anatina]|nr:SET domain-containing protein 4 isoform X2 [Lingula anatina]|eukprot:XP_013400368.1 SET domain-containing protein 4 isoform X2 [Lingula anatina]